MVNTVGLSKKDVLDALACYSGHRFGLAGSEPNVFGTVIGGKPVVVDLRSDEGFCEFWYDRALGAGAAGRAIDKLRAGSDRGGEGGNETETGESV